MKIEESICTNCGWAGYPRPKMPGDQWMELLLWLCFGIPGLIYTIWRQSSQKLCCQKCSSSSVIPMDSPIGQQLAASLCKSPPQLT